MIFLQYELDVVGRTEQGINFLVYVTVGGKKLCIGQLLRHAGRPLWTAFANGNELATVTEEDEGVSMLSDYYFVRYPAAAGQRMKPASECTVEERFYRLRRRIPKQKSMPDPAFIADQVKMIPLRRRELLQDELDDLIYDLQALLTLWRKVRHELDKKTPLRSLKWYNGEENEVRNVKKKKMTAAANPVSQEKPATLKDLLKPDLVDKLKAQADALKAEQTKKEEEKRKQAEEARKAEQKRLENDFEYLLNNSSADWKNYK